MKKLLKIFGAVIALLIITLIAIPFFVSAEMLKGRVADELSKATGRTITIEGNASLKLFPDIAVSLEKVTLGNPAGNFKTKRMFYAEKLDTGVRLMPLLHKEIIITGVTLNKAEINLEETAAGAKNWEFASKEASDTKQEKKEEGTQGSKFAIGDIEVNDSVVNYLPANGKAMALSNIDLALSGADGNEPLALDGNADYKGEQVKISLDVKDSRGFLNGKESPMQLEIVLPGGTLNFDGVGFKKQDVAAKGDVKLNIDALPRVMQWATGNKPAANLPKSLSLNGKMGMVGKRVDFSTLAVKADDLAANGKLSVDASGSVPSLVGTLKLGTIDTSRFSNAPAAQGSAPAAGEEGWSSKPMDLSALKSVNAKLGLAIDGIKSGKLEIGNTAATVNLQGGALKLGIDRMALYSGNAKGNVNLSNAGLATALDVSGVQIEPLMVALNGKSRLTGTASMDLNLNGSGNSQKSIVSSLGGTAHLKFRDGKIKGINIGEFLRNARQGKFYADDSESTDFAELGGIWNFANGIGTNNDLAMKAPILRMTGTGTVNLPGRSINYRLLPSLVASTKGQDGKDKSGLTVPLLVTGPWTKPQITPDLAGMIQEGLKDPEALKGNLKNLKEGIKNFNSPSDIGKALLGGGAATQETAPATTTTEPAATEPKVDPKKQALDNLFKALGN